MSKPKIAPPEELRRLIGIVETTLAGLPPAVGARSDYASFTAYNAAVETAFFAMADSEAVDLSIWQIKVWKTWQGAKMKAGGISTSSTRGPRAAMTNWLNRARAELAYGEAAL